MLEVFSDISYGASADHRSIQGMVVCYGGVPIAWQCAVQPLVAHSTAEAELIAYCESLVIGKATEALLCAIWGEEIGRNNFERIIYGDNAAAIGLAHGVTTSSWRTRHLRIRASVLREALAETTTEVGGGWKLLHLKGTELVADGCTKPLCGQAFFRFVEDLGLKKTSCEPSSTVREVTTSSGGDNDGAAMRAMVLGSLLLSTVEGKNESGNEGEEDFTLVWTAGVLLMALGAIKMGQILHEATKCCLRRLRVSEENVKHRSELGRNLETSSSEEDVLVISEDETAPMRRSTQGALNDPTTMTLRSQSGSHGANVGSSSRGLRSQSGLQARRSSDARARSLTAQRSGIGDGTIPLRSLPQSGSGVGDGTTPLRSLPRSGSSTGEGVAPMNLRPQSGIAAGQPAASSSDDAAVVCSESKAKKSLECVSTVI